MVCPEQEKCKSMNPYTQHEQELIQAAKRAKSGSRQDLQAYLKLRKKVSDERQSRRNGLGVLTKGPC